ncbi:MAG: hypothetical protein R2793_04625 [Flavobacteriaceae bacterium]
MKKIAVFLSFFLASCSLFAQLPANEMAALTDLYQSTNGDQWKVSWPLDKPVTQWEGITVSHNHITEIRMLFNNMEGTIPASIAQLTELKVLELSFNKINGELPETIGSLGKLEVLALNGNDITGSIPASFGDLATLKQLHLSSNQLSGEVPNSINRLENLEVFNVFQNQLSGNLPLALSRNRNLKVFVIAENNFQNTNEISAVLLSNSAFMSLEESSLESGGKPVIAIETSDDKD